MVKVFRRFSAVLILALLISLCSSFTASASDGNDKKIELGNGAEIYIKKVLDEKKIDDTGYGDTLYVVKDLLSIWFTPDQKAQFINIRNLKTHLSVKLKEDGFGAHAFIFNPGEYSVAVYYWDGLSIKFQVHILGDSSSAQAAQSHGTVASPTSSKVLVNGKEIMVEAYNIQGNNFFKLRDLSMAVNGTQKNFEVGWNGEKNTISLSTQKAYTPVGGELTVSPDQIEKEAKLTASKIVVDEKEVQLTAYNIDDNNYFKLRDIAKLLNFSVTWDGQLNTVAVNTKAAYVEGN